jgi:hypothetical protein
MRSVNGWSDVGSAEQELDFGEVKGQQHVNAQLRSPPPVGITFSPLDLLRRTRLNPLNFRCYAYWHRGTNPRNDEVLELLKPWIDKFSWRAGPAIAGPVAVAGCSAKAGGEKTESLDRINMHASCCGCGCLLIVVALLLLLRVGLIIVSR